MKKIFFRHTLLPLFAGTFALTVASCADETLGDNANNGDNDAVVHFEINDAQRLITVSTRANGTQVRGSERSRP